jgi:hypothetical protein
MRGGTGENENEVKDTTKHYFFTYAYRYGDLRGGREGGNSLLLYFWRFFLNERLGCAGRRGEGSGMKVEHEAATRTTLGLN